MPHNTEYNQVTSVGIKYLSALKSWETLDIEECFIEHSSLRKFQSCDLNFVSLKELRVHPLQLSDKSLREISRNLKVLETFAMKGCDDLSTNEVNESLKNMISLKHLAMCNCSIISGSHYNNTTLVVISKYLRSLKTLIM